jgi:hypothetical protein
MFTQSFSSYSTVNCSCYALLNEIFSNICNWSLKVNDCVTYKTIYKTDFYVPNVSAWKLAWMVIVLELSNRDFQFGII